MLNYLFRHSGGKAVLTPKQLEPIVGYGSKQQSLWRNEGVFPIPHEEIGGRVVYRVPAVAEWLVNGSANKQALAQQPATNTPKSKSKPSATDRWRSSLKKPSNQPVDMSQTLLRAFFISQLETQREELDELIVQMTAIQAAHTLEMELEHKDAPKVQSKGRIKV